jgi:hypothetical protein
MQHNLALKVTWAARFSHEKGIFEYQIGIRKFRVKDADLYFGSDISDASGEKHEPIEYYFGDIESRIVDIEEVSKNGIAATEDLFEKLASALRASDIEGAEVTRKYENITEVGIGSYINSQIDDSVPGPLE